MEKIAIIGGGAAGMTCAVHLARNGKKVLIFERGERLGRKLSATGNGQGNVTNTNMGAEHYFSDDPSKIARVLARFGQKETVRFLESMGGIYLPDLRGRVYPAGRQASAVTDLFRRELTRLGVEVRFSSRISSLRYDGQFLLGWASGSERADCVVLAAGGKAAPNFGTDGNAYALAREFGHTVTECAPALVQLRTDPCAVRGLKGVRVDALLRIFRKQKTIFEARGDVLFTESGLSGDAVFRASSYAKAGDVVLLDFLPEISENRLAQTVRSSEDLLCVVCNGLARVIAKRAAGDEKTLRTLIKAFPLTVTGTLGYDYAQVTKGGIPLAETNGFLMSNYQKDLYFAGEILNVDGECGGYNLQWAFASAFLVAEGILSC